MSSDSSASSSGRRSAIVSVRTPSRGRLQVPAFLRNAPYLLLGALPGVLPPPSGAERERMRLTRELTKWQRKLLDAARTIDELTGSGFEPAQTIERRGRKPLQAAPSRRTLLLRRLVEESGTGASFEPGLNGRIVDDVAVTAASVFDVLLALDDTVEPHVAHCLARVIALASDLLARNSSAKKEQPSGSRSTAAASKKTATGSANKRKTRNGSSSVAASGNNKNGGSSTSSDEKKADGFEVTTLELRTFTEALIDATVRVLSVPYLRLRDADNKNMKEGEALIVPTTVAEMRSDSGVRGLSGAVSSTTDLSTLRIPAQPRRVRGRSRSVIDPFGIGRACGLLRETVVSGYGMRRVATTTSISSFGRNRRAASPTDLSTHAGTPQSAPSKQSMPEIYTPKWRKSASDIAPPADAGKQTPQNTKKKLKFSTPQSAGAAVRKSSRLAFKTPDKPKRKKRNVFLPLPKEQTSLTREQRRQRRSVLLSSAAQVREPESEADEESEEDDEDDELRATLHFHHEMDERAALLLPVFQLVDGEWKARKGRDKLARKLLKRPDNVQTLKLMKEYQVTTVKRADRTRHLPRKLLDEYLYLQPTERDKSIATWAPNADSPPIRIMHRGEENCLGCNYCSGAGAEYDAKRRAVSSLLSKLPPTVFDWRAVKRKHPSGIATSTQKLKMDIEDDDDEDDDDDDDDDEGDVKIFIDQDEEETELATELETEVQTEQESAQETEADIVVCVDGDKNVGRSDKKAAATRASGVDIEDSGSEQKEEEEDKARNKHKRKCTFKAKRIGTRTFFQLISDHL